MIDARIFRIAIPVSDIDQSVAFYSTLFGDAGERVWANRHYFRCGEVILALVQPPDEVAADAERIIYLAVVDLEAAFARAGATTTGRVDASIIEQPWGERSFYVDDPSGNSLCFVHDDTTYTGR